MCTAILTVAGIGWAVILGEVCGFISHMRSEKRGFQDVTDSLGQFRNDRLVHEDTRRRLRSFVLSRRFMQRRDRHNELLNSMSPDLHGETLMFTAILIVAGTGRAVTLGEVCGIISHMHSEKRGFQEIMDNLGQFRNDRLVHQDTRRRWRCSVLSKRFMQRRERHNELLSSMSPCLLIETLMCTAIVIVAGIGRAVALGEVCGIISHRHSKKRAFQ